MTSPNCQIREGLAWPKNGASWIDTEFLLDPSDAAGCQIVDRSPDGDETVWKIAFGPDALKIERHEGAVSHLPREIAYDDFTDIVLWGALAHDASAQVMVGLSLYSAEHGLQVPVCVQTDVNGLAGYWTAWAAAYGLSPKVLDQGCGLRDPFHGLTRLMQGSVQPRRLPSTRLGRGAWLPSSEWRPNVVSLADEQDMEPRSQ